MNLYKPFISKALSYGRCDHLPPTQKPYLPLLASRRRRHCPLADTHCAYPRRIDKAELTRVDLLLSSLAEISQFSVITKKQFLDSLPIR